MSEMFSPHVPVAYLDEEGTRPETAASKPRIHNRPRTLRGIMSPELMQGLNAIKPRAKTPRKPIHITKSTNRS